jgi:hypothetical protein
MRTGNRVKAQYLEQVAKVLGWLEEKSIEWDEFVVHAGLAGGVRYRFSARAESTIRLLYRVRASHEVMHVAVVISRRSRCRQICGLLCAATFSLHVRHSVAAACGEAAPRRYSQHAASKLLVDELAMRLINYCAKNFSLNVLL